MKYGKTLLFAALVAPSLVALSAPGDTIAFQPKPGTKVTKTFTLESTSTLDDREMLMDGQENPMMPEIETESTTTQSIVVVDEYVETVDGAPSKLNRSFEKIAFETASDVSMDMMGQAQEFNMHGTGASELEGQTVSFVLDPEAGDYTMRLADDEENDELLAGLVEDMDLRLFLPDGDVSEGDVWDFDLGGLRDVIFPGGNLALDVESDGDSMPMGPDPSNSPHPRDMFAEELEGDGTATYKGTRDADGTKVAIIEVAIDADGASDMTDFFTELMAEMGMEGIEMDVNSFDLEISIEAEGVLLWNIAAGHVHSFELAGDMNITTDTEMEMSMGGNSMSIEENSKMSGTFKCTVDTE